ncbi:MAG: SsrA-binding protein SmpB [Bacteroidales bacterium]|nr:SsrA-binding protein SmpB [Bacteroidales bacterium]
MTKSSINIKNKKAYYEYELIEEYTSGIVLMGTEIKSIKAGKANLSDSYCVFINNELWVKGMHISEYSFGSYNNHETKRDRKLLLTRRELNKLHKKTKEKGFAIVPVLLYIDERGFAKLNIALGKGKRTYDKRQDLKKKDDKREIERFNKN